MLTTSARVERPTPFAVGETLTYDVSWSTALSAGTVVSTVKEKKASFDSTAFYIVAEGRPAPLLSKLYTFYYKVDTLLDVYTLLAQRGSVYSEEGQRHRFGATLFDRMRNRASFEHTTTTVVNRGARERRRNQLPRADGRRHPGARAGPARFVERLEGDAGHHRRGQPAGWTERGRLAVD
jgi:hypothetical protein